MKMILRFLIIITAASTGCLLDDTDNSLLKSALTFQFLSGNPAAPPVDEPHSTASFRDDFNGTAVNETTWQIATWAEHGGQTGRERCYVQDGCLNMVFINDAAAGFLSAAIQTREEFLYGTWEARLKPTAVAGVLNSLYTIDWDDTTTGGSTSDGTKQEIDIEFLSKSFGASSGEVHYAVHASGLASFNTNPDIELGFNPSDAFHVYGFEITPDYISWTVDGAELQRYTYADNAIAINAPYQLKLNVWSQIDSWVGGPPPAGVECIYQIDWIQFTPYE